MPTYEYCCDTCTFSVDEFMPVDERDRPVGSPCPIDSCDGKIERSISANHVQDVTHTEKAALSRGLLNPTGAFKEKMQEIVYKGKSVSLKQKREIKDRYNL